MEKDGRGWEEGGTGWQWGQEGKQIGPGKGLVQLLRPNPKPLPEPDLLSLVNISCTGPGYLKVAATAYPRGKIFPGSEEASKCQNSHTGYSRCYTGAIWYHIAAAASLPGELRRTLLPTVFLIRKEKVKLVGLLT